MQKRKWSVYLLLERDAVCQSDHMMAAVKRFTTPRSRQDTMEETVVATRTLRELVISASVRQDTI